MSNYKNDYMEAYFKNRPHLIPNEPDLEFFYFDWCYYINSVDSIKPRDGKHFTICCYYGMYSNQFIKTCKRLNIEKVYSPHVEFGKTVVDGIQFIPFQHVIPDTLINEDLERIYNASFVGTLSTHPLRLLIYNLFKSNENFKFIIRNEFFYDIQRETVDTSQIIEYQKIMKQSKYVLCPLGKGVGTIRFWEALKYGAKPIVISDRVLLPPGVEYIRIPENDLNQITNIVNSL